MAQTFLILPLHNLKAPSREEEEDSNEGKSTERAALRIAALETLIEIARWLNSQERRTSLAISTSLRLFNDSQQYISCALHLLTTAPNSKNILQLHDTVASLFHLLLTANPGLLSAVTRLPCMLDVVLVLWTATYRDYPLLYPMGKRPDSNPFVDEEGDLAMARFHKVTMMNPRAMVDAVMDGRVCEHPMFITRTVARIESLEYIDDIPNLSHLEGSRIEIGNARYLIVAVDALLKLEPRLSDLLLARSQQPEAFIRTVGTMCKRLYDRNPPEDAEQMDERACHFLGIIDLTEYVVTWVACNSTNILHNMRRMIDSGAFHIIGYVVPFIADQWYTKVNAIFNTVVSYALYPHTMEILIKAIADLVNPQLLKTPDSSYRKGSLGTGVMYILPFRDFLEDGKQRSLCFNPKHKEHVGRRRAIETPHERVCSVCRAVAYCSVRCQAEYWEVIHRHECYVMYLDYRDHNPSRSHYCYRYRKLHANILCYGFETREVAHRSLSPRLPDGSLNFDPVKVHTDVSLLWHDPDVYPAASGMTLVAYIQRTSQLIPEHLRSRFDALTSTFQHWTLRARRRGSGSLNAAHTSVVGSLRLIERAFRFGGIDVMMVLLLEQVKPLPLFSGTLMERDAKATEFMHRGTKKEPTYGILGCLTYTIPRRVYRDRDEDELIEDVVERFHERPRVVMTEIRY